MPTDAERTGCLGFAGHNQRINAVNPSTRRAHLILTLGARGIIADNPTRIKAFCLPDSQTGSSQLIPNPKVTFDFDFG